MAKCWTWFSVGLWKLSSEEAHANLYQKNEDKKPPFPVWIRWWLQGSFKPEDLRSSFALSLAPARILQQFFLHTIIKLGNSRKALIKWFWFGGKKSFFSTFLDTMNVFAKLLISYFKFLSRFCRFYCSAYKGHSYPKLEVELIPCKYV